MNTFLKTSVLACLVTMAASTVSADARDPRPVMSAPYTVANARAAYDEVRSRWVAAQQEQQARYSAFDGELEDFVRSDPILQAVSWPYGACSDMLGLIPPPMDGWGLRSDAPFTTNPVEEERAAVWIVTYDQDLTSDDDDFFASERSVHIRVGVSADSKAFWEMALSQAAMRDAMFEPGPYNYPVTIAGADVLLGDVLVSVSSTDETAKLAYLEKIIGCAIESGMIAEGVDPATLTETP